MIERIPPLTRRGLLAGLGGTLLAPHATSRARAQTRAAPTPQALTLQAKPGAIALRASGPDTPIWSLEPALPMSPMRFRRGDDLDVTLENGLPDPIVLNWLGIDGAPAAEPLLARPAVAAGGRDTVRLPLRHAGTFMCDVRLLGDSLARPSTACAFIVTESEPVAVDRDEVLLIEDWRPRAGDDSALTPGADGKNAVTVYTVNAKPGVDISARPNDRLRLRFINSCQRNVIAIKIESADVRVMALDGQPAEPFLAREGQLVLAPGTRIDVFVDMSRPAGSASDILLHDGKSPRPIARLVTSNETPARDRPLPAAAPLPSNGLPARLDLKTALRFDVALGGSDWIKPAAMTAPTAPVFRAGRGRIVVLAVTNRDTVPAVFRLHGYHFRLLDRLDDGWKPFWLDTLMIDGGQTQRIAFQADHAGRWLMEAMRLDWAAPRLLRWFEVS